MIQDWKAHKITYLQNNKTVELFNELSIRKNKKFLVDYADVVNPAIRYFNSDPRIWKLPAKNYFVRICLAYFVAEGNKDIFYELMNDVDLVPYDDRFAPIYKNDKSSYDTILANIDFNTICQCPGYLKTIDIFGGIYE